MGYFSGFIIAVNCERVVYSPISDTNVDRWRPWGVTPETFVYWRIALCCLLNKLSADDSTLFSFVNEVDVTHRWIVVSAILLAWPASSRQSVNQGSTERRQLLSSARSKKLIETIEGLGVGDVFENEFKPFSYGHFRQSQHRVACR